MKDNKGVTLITLVITIVVLLILAGVSITSAIKPDGIIEEAKHAKDDLNNKVTTIEGKIESLEEDLLY